MSYLRRTHQCNLPATGARLGDVWQCDECRRVVIKSWFGWLSAYQDATGVWRFDSPSNRAEHPAAEAGAR